MGVEAVPYISGRSVEPKLSWHAACLAIRKGHTQPRATIGDVLIEQGGNMLLSRSGWVPGLGVGIKSATVFPQNAALGLPNVHSICTLFDAETGRPKAIIDGDLVTKWKTAADSLLGAQILARTDARKLLIVGAGTVAASLIDGYRAIFPELDEISVWNRSADRVEELVARHASSTVPVRIASDLHLAVEQADIVACATFSPQPLIHGSWVRPGTHVDLIGAFTPDMREADDELIRKAQVYVDSRETTVDAIGELLIPLENGVLTESEVLGDLYDLCRGHSYSRDAQAITFYKNGGGAHLDVMVANYIFEVVTNTVE